MRRGGFGVRRRATGMSAAGGGGEGGGGSPGVLDRPAWAAGSSTGLSRLVNAVIDSPVYPLMKRGARDTLINTAEKNGIAWRAEAERLRQLEASTLEPDASN